MAADNFDDVLTFTLQFEGGFVDDPRDPGGATNLGVTLATLSHFNGRQMTVADVKKLTSASVQPLYRNLFWDAVHGDDLPVGLDLAVFDYGVNSGPVRAVMALQRALGLADDGKIGPLTLGAIKEGDTTLLVQRLCAERLAFLSHLTVFKSFGPGLRNRVAKCEAAALSLIADHVTQLATAANPASQPDA